MCRCICSERTHGAAKGPRHPQPLVDYTTHTKITRCGNSRKTKKQRTQTRTEGFFFFFFFLVAVPGDLGAISGPMRTQAEPRCVPLRYAKPLPPAPSVPSPWRLRKQAEPGRGCQFTVPRWGWGVPLWPSPGLRPSFNLSCGPLAPVLARQCPPRGNFPPSSTRLTPSSPPTQNSSLCLCPLPAFQTRLSTENRPEGSKRAAQNSGWISKYLSVPHSTFPNRFPRNTRRSAGANKTPKH